MSEQSSVRIYSSGLVPPSAAGAAIIIGYSVLLVLATVWTVLRVILRQRTVAGLLVEDYLHLFALVCFYGSIGVSIAMVCAGMGRHINEVGPGHIVLMPKYSFASKVLYALSVGCIKVSICWVLARIFGTSKAIVLGARALIWLSAAWALMTILIGMLICRPVRKNWYTAVPGHCGNQNAAFASVAIVNLAIDLAILILPIRPLLRLQLPLANRLALLAIFSMGMVTMIFAGIRLDAVLHLDFNDFPYGVRMSHIWTISGNAIALIVSSSIYLRPMFDRAFRAAKSIYGGSRSRGHSRSRSSSHSHSQSGLSNGSAGKNTLDGRPLVRATYTNLPETEAEGIELVPVLQNAHQLNVKIRGGGIDYLESQQGIHVKRDFSTNEQVI